MEARSLFPRRGSLRVLAFAVLVVVVRVVGWASYPGPNPDEGFWASGPKNLVKFGDVLMDRRLHPFLSPATFVGPSADFLLFVHV